MLVLCLSFLTWWRFKEKRKHYRTMINKNKKKKALWGNVSDGARTIRAGVSGSQQIS